MQNSSLLNSALCVSRTSASTDPLMSISSRHLSTEISRILERKLWHVMRRMFEKESQQIALTGLLGRLRVQTCLPPPYEKLKRQMKAAVLY